ncbi:MAG: hypothetical protein GWO24_27240, partial [Akkermansiaceae bacterium]|nr:hypothetical protein [Akkermansiaceae bacterium]
YAHNLMLAVTAHAGTLLRNYPLEIESAPVGDVLAEFTVHGGGLGHVPVLLRGTEGGLELKVQRWSNGTWSDLESVDIDAHTYYQAVLNPDGSMDFAF